MHDVFLTYFRPKMTVFWIMRRIVWQKLTDVSEVLAALMTETVSTFESPVNFYHTTRSNIPEDGQLHTRRRQNMKIHLQEGNSALKLCRHRT
jgi:hypothetical protein